eukprot:gene7006-23959_t
MQKTWATDDDKCTFIVLAGAEHVADAECLPNEIDRMAGDVNLFFNDHYDAHSAEVEVMVAEASHPSLGLFVDKLGFQEVSRCKHFEEVTLELPVVPAAAAAAGGEWAEADEDEGGGAAGGEGGREGGEAKAEAKAKAAADALEKLRAHWARIKAVQAVYPAAPPPAETPRTSIDLGNDDLAAETSTDDSGGTAAATSAPVLGPEPDLLPVTSAGKAVRSSLSSIDGKDEGSDGDRRISWGSEVTTFFPRAINQSTLQFGVGLGMGDVPICDHAGCRGCTLCQSVSPTPKAVDVSGKMYPNSDAANERGERLNRIEPKQRRKLLKAAGVTIDSKSVKMENREYNRREEQADIFCDCVDGCKPDTCACMQEGVGCFYDTGQGCKCCVHKTKCSNPDSYKYDVRGVQAKRQQALMRNEAGIQMKLGWF